MSLISDHLNIKEYLITKCCDDLQIRTEVDVYAVHVQDLIREGTNYTPADLNKNISIHIFYTINPVTQSTPHRYLVLHVNRSFVSRDEEI